jgi:hypothetical protein
MRCRRAAPVRGLNAFSMAHHSSFGTSCLRKGRIGWHAQEQRGWAWALDAPLRNGTEPAVRIKRPRPFRWSGRATRPLAMNEKCERNHAGDFF